MCDCGRNECSFCTNQLNLWVEWTSEVTAIMANWKPHTRNEQDERLGQYLFNYLYLAFREDVANKIRGSIVDPFHNDNLIPAFLEKVDELWIP